MGFLGALGSLFSAAAPVVPGGAYVTAGLGALGNIFSQESQNNQALYMQQLGFEHQEKMLERQYEMQLDYMNRQNEWNDPSHQAELYRKAGINPFFALGNGQGGIAQSASPGANVAPPNSPGSLAGFTPDYAVGLRQVANQEAVGRSQANLNDVTAANDTLKTQSIIALNAVNKGLIDEKKAGQVIENSIAQTQDEYLKATQEARIIAANEEGKQALVATDIAYLKRLEATFNVEHMEERYRLEIQKGYAEIKSLYANANQANAIAALSRAQIERIGHEIAEIDSRTEANKIKNQTDYAIQGDVIQQMHHTTTRIAALARRENWSPEQTQAYIDAYVSSAVNSARLSQINADWANAEKFTMNMSTLVNTAVNSRLGFRMPGPTNTTPMPGSYVGFR